MRRDSRARCHGEFEAAAVRGGHGGAHNGIGDRGVGECQRRKGEEEEDGRERDHRCRWARSIAGGNERSYLDKEALGSSPLGKDEVLAWWRLPRMVVVICGVKLRLGDC